MPKIEGFTSQQTSSGQISPNIAIDNSGIQQGIAQNVETLKGFALRANKLEANAAKNRVATKMADEQNTLRKNFDPTSGDDFVTQSAEAYQRIVEEETENASNSVSRGIMSGQMDNMKTSFQMKDQEFVFTSQQAEAGRQLGEGMNESANIAYNGGSPEIQVEQTIANAQDLQVNPQLTQEILDKGSPKIYLGKFAGLLDRASTLDDYGAVKKELNRPYYNSLLDPDDKIRLNKAIETGIRTVKTEHVTQVSQVLKDHMTSMIGGGDASKLLSREELLELVEPLKGIKGAESTVRSMETSIEIIDQSRHLSDMNLPELNGALQDLQNQSSVQLSGDVEKDARSIEIRNGVEAVAMGNVREWGNDIWAKHANVNEHAVTPMNWQDPEAFANIMVERKAAQTDIRLVQGQTKVPLFNKQDTALFKAAWDTKDTATRKHLYATAMNQFPMDSSENRQARSEFATAITGKDSTSAIMFMSPAADTFEIMQRGKGNLASLKAIDSTRHTKLINYAHTDVLEQWDSGDSDAKTEMAEALATYAAGLMTHINEKEASQLDGDDYKRFYKQATEALLGTKVRMMGRNTFIPHDSQGKLMDATDIREATLFMNEEAIIAQTGGIHDNNGSLMLDQRVAVHTGRYRVTRAGITMEIMYDNGSRGVAMDRFNKPIIWPVEKMVNSHNTRANRNPPDYAAALSGIY